VNRYELDLLEVGPRTAAWLILAEKIQIGPGWVVERLDDPSPVCTTPPNNTGGDHGSRLVL
jgi:hypothetical protein